MLLAALALAAAAPQPGTVALLESIRAEDQRAMTIGHRLATGGTALCAQSREPLAGLRFHVAGQYARSVQAAATAHFGLGAYPAILAIAPGGAAERAGLAAGDWVVAIDGRDMKPPPDAADYAAVERVEAALTEALADDGRARLTIMRDGASRDVEVAGELGCASRVELVPGRKLNAAADGRIVQLTTGVLSEARDDDELAFIIAHEMAHNILRHRARLDRIGRRAANIRQAEIEADMLGLRLMHAAGYDVDAAARFWSRFGRKTGAGIFSDGTHLRTGARVRLLAETAATLNHAHEPPAQ